MTARNADAHRHKKGKAFSPPTGLPLGCDNETGGCDMTVHLNPEQAAVVGDAIRAGLMETPDDVINIGVETIRQRLGLQPGAVIPSLAVDAGPAHARAKNLV